MSLARSSEDMQSRFLGGAGTKMEQSIGSVQTHGAHLGEKMDSSEYMLLIMTVLEIAWFIISPI